MKNILITAIIGIFTIGGANATDINLSPDFEKVLENTSRLMSKEGRKDFNKNITYLKKEYKKSGTECDFVVAAYDLHRQSGAGNNTTGFSKSTRWSTVGTDNENNDVYFVHEDEVISEDGKQIVFQRGNNEYKSCIYFKTEEKKKKEREERKQKEKEKKKKKK